MNEKIKTKPITLTPFKRFCMTIGELPSSYLETMSYYEMILWFTKYLGETVIPAINNNAEAVTEVQNLFIELQDYVNNYFENLDIQTEINNKMDEMAESGQLADIMAQYLQLACTISFDTLNDLKEADNIVNGSICFILGEETYNDGKSAYYKIRTITTNDTIDDYNIVALDVSNTLVAERINNYYINRIETNVLSLQTQTNLLINKKVIILGDSYANRTNSWADRLKTALGLTDLNCVIKKESGVGFYNTSDGKNFSTMVIDNIGLNASEITDIIVCGGYNDRGASDYNLSNAFDSFVNTCKTNYPNATIHVGFISWVRPEIGNAEYNNIVNGLANTCKRYISYCSLYKNVHYLNNVEYALHNINLLDDTYFHPTNDGQAKICELVKQAFETGSCNNNSTQINITNSLTSASYITSVDYDSGGGGIYSIINNGISRIFANGQIGFNFDQTTTINLNNDVNLGTIIDGYLQGRAFGITKCEVGALINTSNNGYFFVPATLIIDHGILNLRLRVLNRNGNGWISDSLKYITINGFDITGDSMTQF